MKLEYQKSVDILTASRHDEEFRFGCDDQLQLLAWFAREKPDMVREAMGVDKVIATLEETLAHSKKNLYGFTAEEAGWCGGYESGLTVAIALLKGEGGCK